MGLWRGGDMDMSVERSRGSNGSERKRIPAGRDGFASCDPATKRYLVEKPLSLPGAGMLCDVSDEPGPGTVFQNSIALVLLACVRVCLALCLSGRPASSQST
jgi:hypothetical protein